MLTENMPLAIACVCCAVNDIAPAVVETATVGTWVMRL